MLLAWGVAPLAARAEATPLGSPAPRELLLVLGAPQAPASSDAIAALHPAAERIAEPEAGALSRPFAPSPGALSVLREVDRLLAQARRSLAELDERSAFVGLAQAERLARGALGLPLAAAFYAEVELQLAVTAAQAGHTSLARAALRRAAWVAPRRKLLAGEASPEVVALAARVWSEVSNAPEGELLIEVDAPHARVFLDDVELGEAPRTLRANVGEHALRIEAPGRVSYGALLEIAQGRRPVQRIALAPDASARSLASLKGAHVRADFVALSASLAALAGSEARPVRALVVESDGARALVIACGAPGCAAPRRLRDGRWLDPPSGAALGPASLAQARAWLHAESGLVTADAPRSQVAAKPFWGRWYVWSALAVLAAGAGTAVALAAAPDPEQRLRVVVDPTGLR